MIELLLLRHGDAEMAASSDAERALTAHGVRQADAAMMWLARDGWRPQKILTSPYRRARSTARPFCDLWSDLPTASDERLTPDCSPQELVAAVQESGLQRLLLVAHNPLLSNTAQWLLGSDSAIPFGTASMALLGADVLEQGCAELRWLRHFPDYAHQAAL